MIFQNIIYRKKSCENRFLLTDNVFTPSKMTSNRNYRMQIVSDLCQEVFSHIAFNSDEHFDIILKEFSEKLESIYNQWNIMKITEFNDFIDQIFRLGQCLMSYHA